MYANQYRRHRKARETLKALFAKAEKVLVVHYSCESFYERPDGSSPRITSIAIRNLETGQTVSFSIHQMAELRNISPDQIDDNYDSLEREMLDRLADYLRQRSDITWLHWNMRDQNYGFQAIEHRHRVLGGEPYVVADDRKVDLARLFVSLFGSKYIEHPRLENLVKYNRMSMRNFLPGTEEAVAFQEKRYVDLHRSTIKKVDVLCHLAQRAYDRDLKTLSKWYEARGISSEALFALVQEHPIYVGMSILATIGGIVGLWYFLSGL